MEFFKRLDIKVKIFLGVAVAALILKVLISINEPDPYANYYQPNMRGYPAYGGYQGYQGNPGRTTRTPFGGVSSQGDCVGFISGNSSYISPKC